MMAEFYGKETGCCRGRGGSMHLSDKNVGILATSAIVGAPIALAVGAALSLYLRKDKHIVVVFFGDGATDEGIFYESLNFAALKRLPVLFVCENNFYATNSSQKARQPLDNIFQRGIIFGIKGFRCDGNNARKVSELSERCIKNIRKGGGPFLMECRTYRWKGHVGPDCDVVSGCRPGYEVETWQKKCPIRLLEKYLIGKKILSEKEVKDIRGVLSAEIDQAEKLGKEGPYPPHTDLLSGVYYKD